ncbi:hypothetical protein [Sinomicrobium sp. M5D2P17]
MNKTILILILPLLFLSCQNTAKTDTDILANEMEKKLHSWKLINHISIQEKEKELRINIDFKKDEEKSLESYFIDQISNETVIAMLGYTFFNTLKSYDSVSYTLSFEGGDMNDLKITGNKEILKKNFDRINSSPKLYGFIEYAFKNIRSVDVARANVWLELLNNKSEIFNFKGNFWSLLEDYALACENPKENIRTIYLFIGFTGLIRDPDNPKRDDINQENLLYYLESCGYSSGLTKLPLPDLMDALAKMYEN